MLDPFALRLSKRVRLLVILGLVLACACGLATLGLGEGVPAGLGVLALLHTLLTAGGVALCFAGAGLGLGAVLMRWALGAGPQRWWLALAAGPACLLWISHTLGVVGLLGGEPGRVVALGVCAAGLTLLMLEVLAAVRARPNLAMPPLAGLLWCGAAGLLLVAAASPPGWLWASEGRGYDVLSYHLQLPQEWLRLGRIVPLEHNVYSYLPGGMEAAFLHIAVMLGPWNSALAERGVAQGLVAGDGTGAIACQMLHAGLALVSALLVGRIVWTVAARSGPAGARVAAEAGAVAGAAMLAVPWMVVAGSMAYNEAAVSALIAGAVLAALQVDASAWRRGLVCGMLVGMATACKPTALFFAAPLVGAVLVMELPFRPWARAWAVAAAACVVAGVAATGPYVVRNWAYGGNPVFPAAVNVFGKAHWSDEQAERFARSHREGGTLAARVGLLFASAGDGLGGQARGVFHEQWGGVRVANGMASANVPAAFFPAATLCGLMGLTWKGSRRVVVAMLVGIGAGVAWWLTGSHCQSRFLLPLAVPLSVCVGLGAARLMVPDVRVPWELLRRLGVLAVHVLPLWLTASGVLIFLREGGGRPNAMLADGTGLRTGASAAAMLRKAGTEDEVRAIVEQLGVEAYVNVCLPVASGVLLVGDATPLYYTRPVRYATTWDESPLARAMRAAPDDDAAWERAMERAGIEHIVVSFSELSRLGASGYLDPVLTPERVGRLLERRCVPVRKWEESGHALFRLRSVPEREMLPRGGRVDVRGGGAA